MRCAGTSRPASPGTAGSSAVSRVAAPILTSTGTPAAVNRCTIAPTSTSPTSMTTGRPAPKRLLAAKSRAAAPAHSPTVSALAGRAPAGDRGSRPAGRTSRQLTGTLSSSEASQPPNACWLLTTWPSSETNRRSTPTDFFPDLGITIGRTTQACGWATADR